MSVVIVQHGTDLTGPADPTQAYDARPLWPVRWLGPVMVAFNALVLVSTIPQGGHYLADILSGMAIGLAVLALHYASAARRAVPQPATA